MTEKARVLLLGDSFVGKTSISNYISKGEFCPFTKPTTAVGFIVIHVDETFDIQLWDTAGMERYRSLNKVYFREASGALLVFDFSSKASFDNISTWRDDFINGESLQNSVLFLVGNKHDCVTGEDINIQPNINENQNESPILNSKKKLVQEVSEDEAAKFATENGMQYFAVSALTGEGISELVQAIQTTVPRRRINSEELPLAKADGKKNCC